MRVIYLVSTPIGNHLDITLRALEILKTSDVIACEELKEARRLLSKYEIDIKSKEIIEINEHSEKENSSIVVERILAGKKCSLISDCGTPLFSDPGHYLLDLCIANDIEPIAIPGANSLLPAIVCSNLKIEKFYYYGWLSAKREVREKQLKNLKSVKEVIILMDAPYRLKSLFESLLNFFGEDKIAVLAYNITMEDEKFYRTTLKELKKIIEESNLKGEYVLIIDNRDDGKNYKSDSKKGRYN